MNNSRQFSYPIQHHAFNVNGNSYVLKEIIICGCAGERTGGLPCRKAPGLNNQFCHLHSHKDNICKMHQNYVNEKMGQNNILYKFDNFIKKWIEMHLRCHIQGCQNERTTIKGDYFCEKHSDMFPFSVESKIKNPEKYIEEFEEEYVDLDDEDEDEYEDPDDDWCLRKKNQKKIKKRNKKQPKVTSNKKSYIKSHKKVRKEIIDVDEQMELENDFNKEIVIINVDIRDNLPNKKRYRLENLEKNEETLKKIEETPKKIEEIPEKIEEKHNIENITLTKLYENLQSTLNAALLAKVCTQNKSKNDLLEQMCVDIHKLVTKLELMFIKK